MELSPIMNEANYQPLDLAQSFVGWIVSQ